MFKKNLIAATILFSPFSVSAQDSAALQPVSESAISIGTSITYKSEAMGTERRFNIYLPAAYDKDSASRFPVLYLIDGGVAQDFQHIAGLANLGGLSGMYPDMIVVGVETKDRQNELTTPTTRKDYLKEFPTLGGAAKFRAMIASEIIPYVDATYRTGGDNMVMGESLAAFFVVDTFLNAPETFERYVAISPSMWWDERALGKEAAQKVAALPEGERTFYLTYANEGGKHQKGSDEVAAALQKHAVKGLRWTLEPRTDEEHSTIYHGAALRALRWNHEQKKK